MAGHPATLALRVASVAARPVLQSGTEMPWTEAERHANLDLKRRAA
jgi:hypothetical protein